MSIMSFLDLVGFLTLICNGKNFILFLKLNHIVTKGEYLILIF